MGASANNALTPREALFVEAYLIDLSPASAARKAGYSEKTAKEQGYVLLRKPRIAEAIQHAMNARSKALQIDADYVLGTIRDTVDVVKKPGKTFDAMAVFRGCELLGKHLKLFTEKVEHSGKVAHAVELSDEQLAAIATAGRG